MRRNKRRRVVRALPPHCWEAVVDAAGVDRQQPLLGCRDMAIVALLLGSGLRSFELCDLLLSDVGGYEADTGWVLTRVEEDGAVYGLAHVRHGKGDVERWAAISEWALDLVEAYLDVRPDTAEGDGWLFLSRKLAHGGKLSTSGIRRLVQRVEDYCRAHAAELPELPGDVKIHAHKFRTSHLTKAVKDAAEAGVPITEVAAQAGHKGLEILRQYVEDDVRLRGRLIGRQRPEKRGDDST